MFYLYCIDKRESMIVMKCRSSLHFHSFSLSVTKHCKRQNVLIFVKKKENRELNVYKNFLDNSYLPP